MIGFTSCGMRIGVMRYVDPIEIPLDENFNNKYPSDVDFCYKVVGDLGIVQVIDDNNEIVLDTSVKNIEDNVGWINDKIKEYGFKLIKSKKVNVDNIKAGDHYMYDGDEYIKTEFGQESYNLDTNKVVTVKDKMVVKKED